MIFLYIKGMLQNYLRVIISGEHAMMLPRKMLLMLYFIWLSEQTLVGFDNITTHKRKTHLSA